MVDSAKEKNVRPILTDPKEFAIIRQIYFGDHNPKGYDIEPEELADRRIQGKNRNQSR